MNSYSYKYEQYLNIFNDSLNKLISESVSAPKILSDSMNYSLSAGGKRLRPVLLLATADILGVDLNTAKTFALALECIHTYSLIHDDLPCMDNDDFRRGKPSNHKVFGEAIATLSGDALLTLAFELCFSACSSNKTFNAGKLLANCAGREGMVGGQTADIELSGKSEYSENDLHYVIENKTGKLLMASVLIASTLSGNKYYNELKIYGENLGFLFQTVDDILDVEGNFESLGKTIGKDSDENKLTSVKLYGLDGAKEKVKEYLKNCKTALKDVENSEFLIALAESMAVRTF